MRRCCPPGEGCNASASDELCALRVLRDDPRPEARRALRLWEQYERGAAARSGQRFLRRAYARARDGALGAWTPWGGSPLNRNDSLIGLPSS